MRWINIPILCFSLAFSPMSFAQDFVVLGLFKNKVVLKKGGKRVVLKTGDKTADGLEVVSVDAKQAVLKVDGKQGAYTLGNQISSSFSAPTLASVHIPRDNHGMYRVEGKINKSPVQFLIDTGASALAINSIKATALGLPYKEYGIATVVETASGQAQAYKIQLQSVTVGDITLRDVNAVVVEGSSPREVLLGMSFLKRVDMTDSSHVMQLKVKY